MCSGWGSGLQWLLGTKAPMRRLGNRYVVASARSSFVKEVLRTCDRRQMGRRMQEEFAGGKGKRAAV